MKVIFFNYEYPPLGGGAANATAYILEEYSNISDLEVDLVTSSVDSEYHLEKLGEKIRIHRLPIGKNEKNLHFQSQKDLLVYSWQAYWFSRKLIKNGGYNLSHSFFTVPCGFLSLVFKWQFGLPFVVSLRGADVPGYSERFGVIYALLRPLIRLIWGKAAAVVANSQGLKNLALESVPKQKIEVIYNGINIDQFKPDLSQKAEDHFIITTGASRVTHRKGLNYLFEAVAQLVPKYPNIFLRIMGEGNAREDLEKLVLDLNLKRNIEFLGRIAREKTAPFYQEANIFVLPSLNEGMSNAMLEALATGLPLVATDTGGSKELIQEGENGFIIKMKDSADIAEKIEKLINDPELVKKMGEASRKKAEGMSWERVSLGYYELYKKVKS
jgi:glycosyltransferase involved in cell wall biosynthesis